MVEWYVGLRRRNTVYTWRARRAPSLPYLSQPIQDASLDRCATSVRQCRRRIPAGNSHRMKNLVRESSTANSFIKPVWMVASGPTLCCTMCVMYLHAVRCIEGSTLFAAHCAHACTSKTRPMQTLASMQVCAPAPVQVGPGTGFFCRKPVQDSEPGERVWYMFLGQDPNGKSCGCRSIGLDYRNSIHLHTAAGPSVDTAVDRGRGM